MKGKLKKVVAALCALALVFSTFSSVGMVETQAAGSHTLTAYDTRYNDGLLRVGYFEIDGGTIAMCSCHELEPPTTIGQTLSTIAEYSYENQANELMRKILYYGWGGPADIGGSDDGDHFRETTLAVSVANGHDDNYYGYGQAFINRISGLASAPKGFTVYKISNGNAAQQDLVYYEYNPYGEFILTKTSANTSITDGNDCYSLQGAKYGIYSDQACTSQVATVTTGEDGVSNEIELEEGTYYVKEIEASPGYWLDETVYTIQIEPEKLTEITVEDEPGTDPAALTIDKVDKESGTGVSLGKASLAGAQFTVNYYDGYYNTVEELPEEPTRTWVIETKEVTYSDGSIHYIAGLSDTYKVSGDDFYIDGGIVTIPNGTITVKETKAPEGYKTEGAFIQAGTDEATRVTDEVFLSQIITEDPANQLTRLQAGNEFEKEDQVYRGDFEFTKKDEDGNNLANIPFEVTSDTTGESHIIMTDENGYYSSASDFVKHSENTNGGTENSGLWFGQFVNPNTGETDMVEVNDDLGALPYDTYTVEEQRCDANEGKDLIKFSLTVSRDGYTIDMGTLTDLDVAIFTTAKDAETNSHYSFADDEVTIIDEVTYTGLKKGETYVFTGTVMNKATASAVLDKDGNPVTAEKEFTAKTKDGTVEMEFTFDASELAGEDVVIFEQLTLDGEIKAVHEDINDEDQTIHFPEIQTTAIDGETEDHVSCVDDKITIIDTVSYKNLNPGKKYTISGVLMDKETGEEALDASGNRLTAEVEFTAEESNGEVEVTFVFDGSNLGGKTLVAFEELIRDGKTYAVHADIEDEAQTVYIPKIGSSAVDMATLSQNALADGTVIQKDTVSYENLPAGITTTVKGVVKDAETGEPLLVDDKEVTAEAVFIPREDGAEILSRTPDLEDRIKKIILTNEFVKVSDGQEAVQSGVYVKTEDGKYLPVDGLSGTAIEIPEEYRTAMDEAPEGFYEYGDAETLTLYLVGEQIFTEEQYLEMFPDVENAEDSGQETEDDSSETPDEEQSSTVSGTVDVYFIYDASDLAGKTVVFCQEIYQNEKLVGSHDSIDNEEQKIYYPMIETSASDKADGNKTVAVGGEVTIVDEIKYTNLIPGMTYEGVGTLMNPETKEAFQVDGKEIPATVTFTAEQSEGTVEAEFTFTADESLADTSTVVFEKLYLVNDELEDGKAEVARHEDFESEAQTVKLIKEPKAITAVQTGLHRYGLYFAVAAVLLLLGSLVAFRHNKKAAKTVHRYKI